MINHAIRSGQPEDAVACAGILNDWIDDRPWMPRVHSPEEVVQFYQDFVFQKREVWVTGEPVDGYLGLDPDTGQVTTLYSARPGNGIGKALLDHVKVGRWRLDLWTFQANTDARRFYAREGFREVEESDGDNEENLPDVRLVWDRTRRAGQDDAAACARIVDAWVERTDWMPRLYDCAALEALIAEAMQAREIYMIGDPAVGYLSLNPETAHIGAIYVDRPGEGLGKILLDRAKECRAFLQLNTHEPNLRAQAFYKREGFEVVERIAEGGDGLPELRMEWRR